MPCPPRLDRQLLRRRRRYRRLSAWAFATLMLAALAVMAAALTS